MYKELKIRNQYIYKLSKNGANYAQIGREFNLSRERISKIVKKLKEEEAKLIREENQKI